MADELINVVIPSAGQVASRFVSSSDLESARERREQEWKETYAKLGQEPPPMPKEEYDGRSLYEKLKETKDKKQEAFEEQLKFKNQFRALDDEEVAFLDDAAEEKRAAELEKERNIKEEMARFKKAVATRTSDPSITGPSLTPITTTVVTDSIAAPLTKPLPRKNRKAKDFQSAFLAGAIRPAAGSKKRKSSTTTEPETGGPTTTTSSSAVDAVGPDPKRKKAP
ncbi:hypothetical protein CROQUDRAFT_652623 [Cronartium quercuum f. sp. fusiforme G11]|uniref:FAM192A/Fyv6 N-terminal domain-containing protein n=1 Tax=Cronartium quercuum f. sp. fusiforme G11 TaxID=708437 RepID=A0A9P6NRA1_9BASI|nr:hypothetical protein CROQUDRAFT_652623 [Cronartium quercuum f. sp. fusiforme G11]